MPEIQEILSLFIGLVILKIDIEGNILDVIINTKENFDIKGIKNVYAIFSPEEEARVKRVIEMSFDSKKKYMEIDKKFGINEFVDVEVSQYKEQLYMYIQFFESNRQREVEYERYLEGLLNLSEKDTLTQTFNRHGFVDKVRRMVVDSDPDKRVGIIYIDMDNLKHINDTYGHTIGDKAILSIANILISTVRQRDIVARLGGDEFAVVVEEVSGRKSTAYGLANRLVRKIRKQNEQYSATASLGVHVFKVREIESEIKNMQTFEKALSAEIKEADEAAYKAKNNGRNQICTSANYSKYYKTLSKASV
jgi:diguanylate cyclase (GGDEF)-like protein